MKMIAGLGNPGQKYHQTRHNVGWHALDILARLTDIRVYINRQNGLTGSGFYRGEKLLLVKPLTYMNLSGECLASLAHYYKLAPEDIFVLCDDVYLPAGQLRLRQRGSDGGHNGLKNIIQLLGSQDFPRLKIGVGPQPAGMDLVDFVLKQLSPEEAKILSEAEEQAARAALLWLSEGAGAAMNRYNSKKTSPGEKEKE
ncbi:MAG: aminoacyl-tRNA hydrolase [Lachnospiraceae bacterium]|nr:aminoacyl-tRNA hydrolase [Lachnospiraceae bacterium]